MPYFFLLSLFVVVVTIIDVAKADESEVRTLPKPLWLIIVLLAPFIGAIGWFFAGRPDSVDWGGQRPRSDNAFPEYERLGRQLPANPSADDEFLRQCRERAEQQRQKYREEQRRKDRDGD